MRAVAVAARWAAESLNTGVTAAWHCAALPATGPADVQVTGLMPVAETGSGAATGSATAATGPTPWWVIPALIVVVLLALAVYAGACWIWPFKNCRKCDGSARIKSPSGKAFRRCRKCKASGRRLRFGRWLYNVCRSRRRDAK